MSFWESKMGGQEIGNIRSEKSLKVALLGNSTVLITGQTGTGKSTLAQFLHSQGKRSMGPYVVINLATLHEGTLEAEIFGVHRGAFTGADRTRVGKLELAQGGTVFLDEIGELPLSLQGRFLEFLNSKTVTPLGSNQPKKLDVRVIAATHRDLQAMVKEKTFREDLFQRLKFAWIELDPLPRDQMEGTIRKMIYQISKQLREEEGMASMVGFPKLNSTVLSLFREYRWSGNYRELRSVIEFSLIAMSTREGFQIERDDLPDWFLRGLTPLTCAHDKRGTSLFQRSKDFELEEIRKLKNFPGTLADKAQNIGVSRATFVRRLQQLKNRREENPVGPDFSPSEV